MPVRNKHQTGDPVEDKRRPAGQGQFVEQIQHWRRIKEILQRSQQEKRAEQNPADGRLQHSHFEGIITPMDVLEAIAGEFSDNVTDEPKVVTRADETYLIAGWMPVEEFADLLSLEIDAERDFETVAGLVLDEVGHLPEVGQRLELQDWTVAVVDLDGRRIDKLLVDRAG